MKKFYLYYLLLLGSASAQFKVSGKITELRSGNSLPGANVVLSGVEQLRSTVTIASSLL